MKLYDKEDVKLVLNNIGILLKISCFLFLLPCFVILFYNEPAIYLYLYIALSMLLMFVGRLLNFETKATGGFRHAVVTTLFFWVIFNFFVSVPFVVIEDMSFINAYFEGVSATTTTGLSMISDPGNLMHSSAFWRSFIGWIGGLGIVILALLGVFMSYNNFKQLAEAEGRGDKIQSSIIKTIKSYWVIYLVATIIGIVLLSLFGMPIFDAICYSFNAISTNGMDINSTGILGYGSLAIIIILLIMMLFGATSFITHNLFFREKKLKAYFSDPEYLFLIAMPLLITLALFKYFKFIPIHEIFLSTASIAWGGTTLNYVGLNLINPDFYKILIIFVMFVGGSSASASGGIKIQRFLLLIKSTWWKLKEFAMPKQTYFTKKFCGKVLNSEIIRGIFVLTLVYVIFILTSTIIFTLYGYPFLDSLFEITSAQGNIGISVGIIGAGLPLLLKIIVIFEMLLGRLEIVSLFIVFGFFIWMRRS